MNGLAIFGLILNTIGSTILAFSLNRYIRMINTSITALEAFKDTFLEGGDILSFTGLEDKRKEVSAKSKIWTTFGVWCLILGFVIQLIGGLICK